MMAQRSGLIAVMLLGLAVAISAEDQQRVIRARPGNGIVDGKRLRTYHRGFTVHKTQCAFGPSDTTVDRVTEALRIGDTILRVVDWAPAMGEHITDSAVYDRSTLQLRWSRSNGAGYTQRLVAGERDVVWSLEEDLGPSRSDRIELPTPAYDAQAVGLLLQAVTVPYREGLAIEFLVVRVIHAVESSFLAMGHDTAVVVGAEGDAWVVRVPSGMRFLLDRKTNALVGTELPARDGECGSRTRLTSESRRSPR